MFVFICYTLLCSICFCNHLEVKRKLVAMLLLSYRGSVTINVLCLFFMVPWVGLQCVSVVYPVHTHFMIHSQQ